MPAVEPSMPPSRAPLVAAGDWFAAPAPAALVDAHAALAAAVAADLAIGPLREVAWLAGDAWIQAILDGLILAVAAASRGPGAGRRTATTVRDLADRVIGQGIRRADRDRFGAFVAFLDRHVDAAGPVVRFPVDDAMAGAIAAVVAVLRGGGEVDPHALARALRATIDTALARLLDEPLALLGLGPFARTATRIGRVAVASRAHGEVERAVRDPAAAHRLAAWLVASIVAAAPR